MTVGVRRGGAGGGGRRVRMHRVTRQCSSCGASWGRPHPQAGTPPPLHPPASPSISTSSWLSTLAAVASPAAPPAPPLLPAIESTSSKKMRQGEACLW